MYNYARINCIIARTIKHDQWSDIPVVMFHQFVAMSEHPLSANCLSDGLGFPARSLVSALHFSSSPPISKKCPFGQICE